MIPGSAPSGTARFAMVRFARQASAAEITNFLQNYQATLVDGPTPGGLYRVRVAMTSLAKEELSRIIAAHAAGARRRIRRAERVGRRCGPAFEPSRF